MDEVDRSYRELGLASYKVFHCETPEQLRLLWATIRRYARGKAWNIDIREVDDRTLEVMRLK